MLFIKTTNYMQINRTLNTYCEIQIGSWNPITRQSITKLDPKLISWGSAIFCNKKLVHCLMERN